jgi:hypothetical protein
MRIKTRWHKTDTHKSPEEIGGALAFIGWRIAAARLDNLENEGFEFRDIRQRFAIVQEFLAYLLQIADRVAYTHLNPGERTLLINEMAKRLAITLEENLADFLGEGDYRRPFIALLNERGSEYAELGVGNEAGYGLLRYLGDCVSRAVGEEQRRWLMEQVIEIEAPEAAKVMQKAVRDLLA